MDLKNLTNESLLSRTREIAREERRLTHELLLHLLEIESRKLYLGLGHSSLFMYVTRELRYSEASAQRRIDAARLLRQVPEIEEKIVSGELTLGSIGKAQQFFREERKRGVRMSRNEKSEIVLSLSGLSTRQAESKLLEMNPDAFRLIDQQQVRELPGDRGLSVTLVLSPALREKLERVREIRSHVDAEGAMDYAAMMERLAEFYLEKNDPLKKAERAQARAVARCQEPERDSAEVIDREPIASIATPSANDKSLPQRRSGAASRSAIPKALEHRVRIRAQNRCTWLRPDGSRCGSRWQVQIDHILPKALGGLDTLTNLRCLCRKHNLLAAQQALGTEVMARFGSAGRA